jgi:hypothetical protein
MTSHEPIARRLEALERELASLHRTTRRMRLSLVTAIAIGAGFALAAAAPYAAPVADVVRAKRLEIVDDRDRVIALLGAGAEGGQLDLWNAAGVNAARLAGGAAGGDLSLWNASGRSAAGLFASDGGGRVEVYDPVGAVNGRLAASRDGGVFTLLNGQSKPGVLAAATDRGGGISACDSLGRPLAELAIVDGAGQVHLSDRTATTTALIGSAQRGGMIELADAEGRKAFAAGADVGGGSMSVFAPSGTEIVAINATANGGGSVDVRNAAGRSIARSFTGEDESGRWVVSSPDGSPAVGAQGGVNGGIFAILASGRRMVQIDASAAGGRIETTDASGLAGLTFGIDAGTKGGAMSLRNDRGQEVLRLSNDERGSGAMTVTSRTGTERRVYSTGK